MRANDPLVEDEDEPSQPQTWVAARGNAMRKQIVPRQLRQAGLDRLAQSTLQVPTWPVAVDCPSLPSLLVVCVRIDAQPVSSLALSPLSSSHPVVQSHLPMWSSPPRPWSSSSCVRGRLGCLRDGATRWSAPPHRCAGEAGATRLDERDGLRSRCEQSQSGGRTPSGSRGGRIVPSGAQPAIDTTSGLSLGEG